MGICQWILMEGETFWGGYGAGHSCTQIYYIPTVQNDHPIHSNAAGVGGMGSSQWILIEGDIFWMGYGVAHFYIQIYYIPTLQNNLPIGPNAA